MPINLDSIKTKSDLKDILNFLDKQGFGYISDWELHNKKINHIINKNNTLGVKYDDKLKSNLEKYNNYEDADKEAKKYFSKFGVDDKIFELLNEFYLESDESNRTPYINPSRKDIIEWYEFAKKHNLTDKDTEKIGISKFITFYNLDKNFIKVRFGSYKSWEFKKLYELVFGEEPKEFNEKKIGDWQDLGKIQIKFFQKGTIAIKGDLIKLKEYYYKYLKKERGNTLIKYNKKMELDVRED